MSSNVEKPLGYKRRRLLYLIACIVGVLAALSFTALAAPDIAARSSLNVANLKAHARVYCDKQLELLEWKVSGAKKYELSHEDETAKIVRLRSAEGCNEAAAEVLGFPVTRND